MGNVQNSNITVIDTPGTGDTDNQDCEHAVETVRVLKEEVGSIDVIVLLFKGTNFRTLLLRILNLGEA